MALPDNPWLPVLLSAIAALHAYFALDVISRVSVSRGSVATLWLTFGAAVLAVGVWVTELLGAPAGELGVLRGVSAGGVIMLGASLAWQLMGRCHGSLIRIGLAGLMLGSSLVLASLLALRLGGPVQPPPPQATAGMWLCGCLGAWLSLRLHDGDTAGSSWRQRALAALVLGLTINAVPMVGAAMSPWRSAPPFSVAASALAVALTISALVLLLAAAVQRAQRQLDAQGALIRAELESARQALVHQAFHDTLTALPNRANVLGLLQELLPRARHEDFEVAVMFIDLDGFKSINDTLGHEAGDEFLRRVADALRSSVRARDTVARFGGDEFVIVLERYRHRANLTAICDKILAQVSAPVDVVGHKVTATPSIGVAMFPSDGEDAAELLRHADLAMYAAKQRGKASFCFYEPRMIAQATERLVLSTELREGLSRGEIEVYYQPKACLHEREWVGLEALARWAHPRRGQLLPSMFIPLAEDCGLISRVGAVVLREVVRQIAQWRHEGLPLVPVAINLSMQEVQGEQFVPNLLRTLEEAGVPRDAIDFEITESAAMTDVHATLARLRELESLGFRLSIDDFGTGFSSLSHLRQLPTRVIKIDQSFVQGARTSHHDREITEAIIALARKLHLQTIAEGVETEDQARWLADAGCEIGQGFLFGRPSPPAEIRRHLLAQRAARRLSV